MDENNRVLERLINSFDDFKERLIRIEENVKGFNSVKEELDTVKVDVAQTKESVKSSHKRMDGYEEKEKTRENDIKWLKRQIIIGGIGLFVTIVGGIIGGVVLFMFTNPK